MNRIHRAVKALVVAGAALAGPLAMAQDAFPSRPVKLVVGYAAGGPTDVIARVVGQDMSATLGQPVVVENRAGANGNIATEGVARAPADGYTVIVNTLSHNVNALLSPDKVKYDPVKNFAPVSLAVVLPQLLVVGYNSPYQTLGDLVKAAKAAPDSVSYGSAGTGGSAHLAAELLAQRASAKMTHVPYRGNAPAMTEVMAGRVSFMFYPMIGVNAFVADKKVRILAVTTAARHPDYPTVPTMAEAGYPGFEAYVGPVGFMAPAGTPPAAVQKLAGAIRTALAKPAIRDQLVNLGGVVVGSTPDEYRDWLRGDAERWAQLIKAAGIKGE
ncbi:Bug family tripartite tricarboxylate transporter substrate binding protein [Ramlibacter sp. MAHUQ-53]|uniref:Bug family tripartite tricarboxylate transporter substrate binding protein n=1 Tax=unclassified Ramlibacter TaxID=2617605 RepID=UPI0036322FF8